MSEEHRARPPRRTGVSHLFAAAGYSLAGARRVLRESAFRQEVMGAVIILAVLAFAKASGAQMIGAAILLLILFATEALNTALEEIVDHLSPQWSEFAKNAKDLGSFAVMCILLANGLYLGWVALSLL
jgi:diacylglycerol kinase (ATP)